MWKFDVGLEVSFKPLFLSALKHVFVAKTYKMFWRMDHTRKFMCVIIQSNKTKLMGINSGNKFSLIISNIQERKNVSLGRRFISSWRYTHLRSLKMSSILEARLWYEHWKEGHVDYRDCSWIFRLTSFFGRHIQLQMHIEKINYKFVRKYGSSV